MENRNKDVTETKGEIKKQMDRAKVKERNKGRSNRKNLQWAGIKECRHKKKIQNKQKIYRICRKQKDKWTDNGKRDVKRGGQTDKQNFNKRAIIFYVTRPDKKYQ